MSAGERRARHLLPQQRAAPGGLALARGLLLHRQRRTAHRRHPALRQPHLSVHRRRALAALARGGGARRHRRGARRARPVRAAGEPRATSSWRRPAPSTAAAMELSLLAQATVQTIERYYLAIALLERAGSGADLAEGARGALPADGAAHDAALRLQLAGVLRSRAVRQLHQPAAQRAACSGSMRPGCLAFDEVLVAVARDAEIVLSEQIRHSILQVTHG